MKSKLLLPNRCKWIGLLLFIPFAFLGALYMYTGYNIEFLDFDLNGLFQTDGLFNADNGNLTDEVAITGIIVSLLLIAFAREKEEDEFIHLTRLESWQFAVLVNFVLLLIAIWAFYGFAFLNVMVYNMLTILVIFIIRFQWIVYRNKKEEAKSFAL